MNKVGMLEVPSRLLSRDELNTLRIIKQEETQAHCITIANRY